MVINKKAVLLGVLRVLLADWDMNTSSSTPLWSTLEGDLNEYLFSTKYPTIYFAPVEDGDARGWQPKELSQAKREQFGSPDPHSVHVRLDLAQALNALMKEARISEDPQVKVRIGKCFPIICGPLIHDQAMSPLCQDDAGRNNFT